jgi:hypothetical protein
MDPLTPNRPRRYRAAPHHEPRRYIWTAANCAWHDIARYCFRYRSHLSPREADFVANLTRWKGNPSWKQLDWLDAIAWQLDARARARKA